MCPVWLLYRHGRHLDADEAAALGAGLFAANLSTSFRLRKFGMVRAVLCRAVPCRAVPCRAVPYTHAVWETAHGGAVRTLRRQSRSPA